MGDAGGAGADQEIVDRLAGAAQRQRAPAGDRAQENLQAAVAADVVEGRPVLDRGCGGALRIGAGQRRQRMDHHFRIAGGAGGQQHPFGRAACARARRRVGAAAARMARRVATIARRRRDSRVIDDRVGLGVADDGGQMPGFEIGRAEHDAARPAVEFDQRGGGLQGIAGHQDDGAAVEPFETVAETGRARQDRRAAARRPPSRSPGPRRRRLQADRRASKAQAATCS